MQDKAKYVHLVDLGTGRINWESFSYLNFAIAKKTRELGQEEELVRESIATPNFCHKVTRPRPFFFKFFFLMFVAVFSNG